MKPCLPGASVRGCESKLKDKEYAVWESRLTVPVFQRSCGQGAVSAWRISSRGSSSASYHAFIGTTSAASMSGFVAATNVRCANSVSQRTRLGLLEANALACRLAHGSVKLLAMGEYA